MPARVTSVPTEIPDVRLLKMGLFGDDRGYFSEVYVASAFEEIGIKETFLQDNLSCSRKGTLRGLHYQIEPRAMGKLVRALRGAIFDVAVDLRRKSPTFGKWVGHTLSDRTGEALWIPAGFAHGFLALEEDSLVLYKCTDTHAPETERSVNYADPAIGIRWPGEPRIVSPKDLAAPMLADAEYNFTF